MRLRRSLVLAAVLFATAASVSACAATTSIEVSEGTVVVDVRTPEEFASGHLEGAVNVNLQSGAFEDEIAEFPVDGEYVVYCRTGNRSAQAVQVMQDSGFTDVTDAGGIDDAASATGLAIVTE